MTTIHTGLDHLTHGIHDQDLKLQTPFINVFLEVVIKGFTNLTLGPWDVLNPILTDGDDTLVLKRDRGDDRVLAVPLPHVRFGIEYRHLVGGEEPRPFFFVAPLDQCHRRHVCAVDVLVAVDHLELLVRVTVANVLDDRFVQFALVGFEVLQTIDVLDFLLVRVIAELFLGHPARALVVLDEREVRYRNDFVALSDIDQFLDGQ